MTRTLQVCKAMLVTGIIEMIRRKDLYVLLVIMIFMTMIAYMFRFFGVSGLQIFVKDMAFNCVGLLSTIIATVIAGRQLPDEIQRRTIYPLLARPISRWQLLVGKFVAAWVTSCLCFLALLFTALLILFATHIPVAPIIFEYTVLKCFGFLWLCGFTMFLTSYLSQGAAIAIAFLLSLGAGVFTRAYLLLVNLPMAVKPLVELTYGFFPNYNLFDLTKKLIYGWPTIGIPTILFLMVYGMLMGLFWLRLGWLRFRTQAL